MHVQLLDGRVVDVCTESGADAFLQAGSQSKEHLSNYVNRMSTICAKRRLNAKDKGDLLAMNLFFESISWFGSHDVFRQNVEQNTVKAWLEHVVQQIKRFTNGKFVIGFVKPIYRCKYDKKGSFNPTRLVRTDSGESFRAKLYHPSAIPDILLAMTAFFTQYGIPFENEEIDRYDWEKANSNPSTPVLISAEYGYSPMDRSVDVTLILHYLLLREENLRLILKKPINGPRYWYNYLFGDPCYGQTKILTVTMRMPNGSTNIQGFSEDTSISIPLRRKPSDISSV